MKKYHNNNKGFTLVEILLVVGFIALAGIGIYTIYTKVNKSNIALQESKNINVIKAGIKNIYGGSQGYTGLSNNVLNDARVIPDSMRKLPYQSPDSSINNSFGGPVLILPTVLAGSGVNNGFRISYAQVPGEICVKLVSMMDKNIEKITVHSTVVKEYGTEKLDIVLLTSSCGQDSGNGVDIIFDSL